ncbi:hypothetical protein BKA59DRAFT_481002 [Fusarium tricinctum]|uniref:NWD NACHT-NTPase N-terminal domain-containing protein n=1 Tax=Fusarium tricinctum TaxID=61284 RepID=A0A8K0RUU8_9HYPO|nr:hypothetical protein BKA59DRAFT_481002 [Fusarium tricinctum]
MQDHEPSDIVEETERPFNIESLWAKAYKIIQNDENHSQLLDKFEAYLQKAGDEGREEISSSSQSVQRVKDIQKMAENKLENLPENRTSLSIGGKRVIVRESVQKAIRTITQFKPLISGAVSAEPHAALAWACILGVLPILESIFQQDEAAADGLGKIIFLLVRYQDIQDTILSRNSGYGGGQTETTQQLSDNIESKLVSIYANVYMYQIQFVLQYGRSKWRRNLGGIFKPEDWKRKWNEIDSARQLVDQGIQDRVGARILDTWEVAKKIEVETTETLKVVYGINATSEEIQNAQKSTKERDLLLSLPVATKATFDSTEVLGAENPCLEGTQQTILAEIQEWAEDPTGEMIFWLHGLAGTGKSTIALTVADALKQRRPFTTGIDPPERAFLGASFFFKQGDASRNHIQTFFTTLAMCLAEVFLDFKSLIARAIDKNLTIGTKAPQEQLENLIAKPFSTLNEQSLVALRLVIVVDALDECLLRTEAESLITMLVGQLKDLQRVQLRFLITSRSERHIMGRFEQLPKDLYRSVFLEKIKRFEQGDDTKDDITLYLACTLAKVANKRGVPVSSVTESTIKELSNKSDGLFIYAATACRFLDAEDFDDEEARQERLDLILESNSESDESGINDSDIDDWEADSPQNKIDEIYRKVLSFPDRERMSPRTKQKIYNGLGMVLGFLVVFFKPVSTLVLKKFLPSLAESMDQLLKKLHALVSVPQDEKTPLEVVHTSFRDFILSKRRSTQLRFQVQENKMHKEALVRCLDIMSSELHEDICELLWPGITRSEIPQDRVEKMIQRHLRYACRYWVDHLSKLSNEDRRSVGLIDGGSVHTFLESHFLHWLEVMILTEEVASTVLMLNKLQILVQHSDCPDLFSSISYMKQFILNNIWITDDRPLQIYVSATTFSLKDSKARSLFEAHTPRWISQLPKVEEQWTSKRCVLQGHTEKITCTAFSPAFDLVLTVSLDRTARLWDSVTGTQRFIFEKTDQDAYTCGAFSSDGKAIGLGTRSGKVEVKEFLNKRSIQLGGHEKGVEDLTFSPKSSNVFASTSKSGDLKIWSIDERCTDRIFSIRKPYGTDEPPSSEDSDPAKLLCQFTPNGKFLIVGGTSVSMGMWDVESGECIKVFASADTTFIMDLKVSSGGNYAIILQTPEIRRLDGDNNTGNDKRSIRSEDNDGFRCFRHIKNYMSKCTVTIINLATEEIEFYCDENEQVRWISMLPQNENHIMVGGYDNIELLDTKTLSKVMLFDTFGRGHYFTHSRDGRIVATREYCDLTLWDMPLDAATDRPSDTSVQHINSMEPSTDNKLGRIPRLEEDGYDIHDSTRSRTAVPINAVESIYFAYDGRYIALGFGKGVYQLWNKSMTTQIFPFKELQKIIFSPNGESIALVSTKGGIEVVDSTTLEVIMMCEKTLDLDVCDIELSPDGRTICISYVDSEAGNCSIELWSVISTECFWRKCSPRTIDSLSFKFSPDSKFLAFCWGACTTFDPGLWIIMDLSTFKEILKDYYVQLVFHPKAQLFAILTFTEDADGYIEIRRISSLSLVCRVECDVDEGVLGMAFTPSGSVVVSEDEYEGSMAIVRMWDIEKGTEIGSYTIDGKIGPFWIPDDGHLRCPNGRLPLPSSFLNQGDKDPAKRREDEQDLLYLGHQWIYRGLEEIMWLPPAFQSTDSVLYGDTLAMAYKERDMRLMKFDLAKMPVRWVGYT